MADGTEPVCYYNVGPVLHRIIDGILYQPFFGFRYPKKKLHRESVLADSLIRPLQWISRLSPATQFSNLCRRYCFGSRHLLMMNSYALAIGCRFCDLCYRSPPLWPNAILFQVIKRDRFLCDDTHQTADRLERVFPILIPSISTSPLVTSWKRGTRSTKVDFTCAGRTNNATVFPFSIKDWYCPVSPHHRRQSVHSGILFSH